MKRRKPLVLLSLLVVLVGGILLLAQSFQPVNEPDKENLIRFHVIAHSDTPEDQALKRAVRDELLAKIGSDFAQVQTKEQARRLIKQKEAEIRQIAQAEIRRWGKDYGVEVVYGSAHFPTKTYGNFVLPAGEYEALKVIIGEGKGENWWCVLFPPLCFVDITSSLAHEEPAVSVLGDNQKKQDEEEVTEAFKVDKLQFRFKFLDFFSKISPINFGRYGREDVI